MNTVGDGGEDGERKQSAGPWLLPVLCCERDAGPAERGCGGGDGGEIVGVQVGALAEEQDEHDQPQAPQHNAGSQWVTPPGPATRDQHGDGADQRRGIKPAGVPGEDPAACSSRQGYSPRPRSARGSRAGV